MTSVREAAKFRGHAVRPVEVEQHERLCPVRGCKKMVKFVCCYEYFNPRRKQWIHVEKVRCRVHAAVFASSNGITLKEAGNGEA